MYKGFYNLTSGMLTQQRNLDVVGHNLVNISTAGFKQSRYTATTFDEVLYSRTGNSIRDYKDLGNQSYIRATSQVYVDYGQGIPEPTDIPLDFCIQGEGFFCIENTDGERFYTRAGSFSLDDEGYLCFPGQGYVLDPSGRSIRLQTDKLQVDGNGRIFTENGGYLGQLGVYTFEDYGQVENIDEELFTGEGARPIDGQPTILWKYLERSNVDMVQQMTELLTCQRTLQSAAQVAKMYDELMNKATNNVGQM